MELADRTVVITGAPARRRSRCPRRFAAESPRALVLADLNREGVEAVAQEVDAVAVEADVGREEDVRALIERATETAGPIDVFFSNAGIGGAHGGPEIPDEIWERAWRVNVMAHIWAARALLPGMVERGDGYLLSTASAAGILTEVGTQVYSVTKHAAVSVAEWLSINYGDAGIKVSCLCPLGVRTPMLEGALEESTSGAALLRDELLEPGEVADVVVDAIRDERFLIFPHPQVAKYMAFKGGDNERWLAGMRRMVRQARESGAAG
jgi:NAD(P)-dependent dehydrogenase (short-subunit alcohol dehydrogenase family)